MSSRRVVPSNCSLECQPMDLSFHPSIDCLSVGCVDGSVEIFRYNFGSLLSEISIDLKPINIPGTSHSEKTKNKVNNYGKSTSILKNKPFDKYELAPAIRCIKYSYDGTKIFTTSSEGRIAIIDAWKGKVNNIYSSK